MRLKIIASLVSMCFMVLGLILTNTTLVVLSSLIAISSLVYLTFSLKERVVKILSEEFLSDPLKALVSELFKIPGILSVEINLSETIDAPAYKSFAFGVPKPDSVQTIFKLAVGDLEFGNFKVYSNSELVGYRQRLVEELGFRAAVAMLVSQFRTEIFRLKKLSEQSIKARTGFLANLSHEIRGPLGNILNSVEMILEEKSLSEEVKELAEIAVKNCRHLLTLINDILEFAKTEASPSADKKPLNISKLLRECVDLMRSFASKKDVKIFINLPDQDVHIFADKRQIKQIMLNLLSNAIKYNKKGGSVFIEGMIQGKRFIISVKDTGVGISPEFLPKVFDPFERENKPGVNEQTGTGLGLALVKKLVELNDGVIEVESEVGEGSVFSLGFLISDLQERSEETAEKRVVDGKGAMLAISETLNTNLRALIRYLAQRNFKLAFGKTFEDLYSLVGSYPVDLILVDTEFLGKRQRDFVEVLRSLPGGKHVPLGLISPKSFDFEIEMSVKSGFDLCLIQPFNLEEAALKIIDLIETHKQVRHNTNFSEK